MQAVFQQTLEAYRERINRSIEEFIPSADQPPKRLHEAMRYSLLAGGKRLRPILVLIGSELYPQKADPMPLAVAIECFHTGTLIHDDLPIFDNSDLRRGAATCHKRFDDATALLAGDTLMLRGYELIAKHYAQEAELALALITRFSRVCGSQGVMAGQMADFLAEKQLEDSPRSAQELVHYIHANKTAGLISASLEMGAMLTEAPADRLELAADIGLLVGMAFQIIDDILDVSSDSATLGKTAQADVENGKLTFPGVFGLESARAQAGEFTRQALALCHYLPQSTSAALKELINHLLVRQY